jgi:cytoskeletal protein CcmA (bactofilin family)
MLMLPNFKKPETPPKAATSPIAAAHSVSNQRSDRNISIIGSDLIVYGVVSKGELRIDGEVKGDIDGNRVAVGEQARVTGTVRAEDVVIFGQVMGSVGGRRVSLQSTSRVEGDVYHQALILEQGAFFEGKSVRSDDPLVGHRQRLCRDKKVSDSGASNCA